MTGLESILRRLFSGRARRWSIITVNAMLVLALGLPAADEYFVQRQREADLSAELEQAEEQLQRAAQLRNRVTAVSLELSTMEERALFDDGDQQYRQVLVQSVRQSGCQLRKLTLENPNLRSWDPQEDPLSNPRQKSRSKKETESDYRLRTQKVSLSISGALTEVRAFLTELQAKGKLMHITQLSIRPNGRNRSSVVLELQYQLFGLEKGKAGSDSA